MITLPKPGDTADSTPDSSIPCNAGDKNEWDTLAPELRDAIRTPINLIMSTNALLLESALTDKQRQYVEISYRNVGRLVRLINSVLDLSMAETGELLFDAIPFDLNELLEECAATVSATVENNGLGLETAIDANTWRYWTGDAERLQQVLVNLIGHSAKFAVQGKINVEVYPENSAQGEKGLRFEVINSGPYEAAWFGLAGARAIVEKMAGQIWVDQKPDQGAKFVFTAFLPPSTAQAVHERYAALASARVPPGLKAGTRILVVEDNPETVILLRAYLDNLSLSLDFAANGLEAVEKRKQGIYHLVLMDMQMPIMDGHAAAREIRAWEKAHGAPRVPIVALNAHALSGASTQSLAAGCDGHVAKPVERQDLIAAVAKFAQWPAVPRQEIPEAVRARRPVFLANRRSDLEKMRLALVSQDFALVSTIGHNCKGIGTGYGFPEISAIGLAIEKAAKALNAEKLQESIAEFERLVLAASNAD